LLVGLGWAVVAADFVAVVAVDFAAAVGEAGYVDVAGSVLAAEHLEEVLVVVAAVGKGAGVAEIVDVVARMDLDDLPVAEFVRDAVVVVVAAAVVAVAVAVVAVVAAVAVVVVAAVVAAAAAVVVAAAAAAPLRPVIHAFLAWTAEASLDALGEQLVLDYLSARFASPSFATFVHVVLAWFADVHIEGVGVDSHLENGLGFA